MDNLMQWFQSLETTQQFYWLVALLGTVVFFFQTILTIIGLDAMDGVDADFDVADGSTMDTGGAMSLFSIRSLVNFMVGFGWAGVTLHSSINSTLLLTVVAFAVGVGFGAMYPFMMSKLRRLEKTSNLGIADSLGKQADVYLRIPASGEGRGKVQVSLGGSIHEYDAVSADVAYPTGSRVLIIKVEDNLVTVQGV